MDYWIAYFFALSTISFQSKTLAFEMTLNQNAENSQSLEIYMNMVNIVSSMSITRPDGSKGSCTAPILGIPGVCTTGLSQDLSTGVTTFTIGSVLRSRDQGVWTSSHGTEPGSINITVLTTPTLNVTNQPLSSLTLSSDASLNTHSLSAMVICAYPGVSLDLSFVPTTGGSAVSATLSTASCSLSSTTVCSDIEANSYNCTITPQKENNLSPGTKYYIQVTVNLDGQYQPIGLNSLITDTEIIVPGTPTTPTPSPCRCDWDWLPCDWECYYFYIIIAAVVVVVVLLLVVGVCCCCRHGYCSDDDAEACVCCVRKKKSCKDSVNLNENENGNTRSTENIRLNENENGQKNVPRSSENGRQVNPSESGKEDTSESRCHGNPAYLASEGTDM